MQTPSEFWAPIIWYADFYDVPRLLCASVEGGTVVLDCPFSDALAVRMEAFDVTRRQAVALPVRLGDYELRPADHAAPA